MRCLGDVPSEFISENPTESWSSHRKLTAADGMEVEPAYGILKSGDYDSGVQRKAQGTPRKISWTRGEQDGGEAGVVSRSVSGEQAWTSA